VCAAHAASTKKNEQEEAENKAIEASHYLPFFKRGYFGLYNVPSSHVQHEDTHGKHHRDDKKQKEGNETKIQTAKNTSVNANNDLNHDKHKKKKNMRGKYKQRKISFLDLLTHQYRTEVNEFIDRVHEEMLKLDWTDNVSLPKFQVIKAIRSADPFLPNDVVHKYYFNGTIDLFYNNQKRKNAEDMVNIDLFINNLRYTYTRPFDIYKNAVVDHLDHENVRAVLSFGSLNLGATDSMKMRNED
jgi:hypothetical protein